MTETIEKRLSKMCNLSQGIREDAFNKGFDVAKAQERENGIKSSINLAARIGVAKEVITKELAAEFNFSISQAEEYVQKYYPQ